MNVNLIIPPQKQLEQPRAYVPLGLGYLAAVLERENHSVSITDLNEVSTIPDADVYGITSVSASYPDAKRIALNLKERGKVVIGGIHPSLYPEQVFQDTKCDYVVVGEGENVINSIVLGQHPTGIVDAGYIKDINTLPLPARHLFSNIVDYSGIHGQEVGVGATTLISSRGCPYSCAFCTKIPQTSIVRYHSPERMVMEMKTVTEQYDVTHFRFVDDIFTLNRERVARFCNLKRREREHATWICITRADKLDRELLNDMCYAGCKEIHIGVESGSQRVLDLMNKNIPVSTLIKTITRIKEANIRVKIYLIYGYPGETEDDREKTMMFMKKARPDKVTVSQYTPSGGWFYPDEDKSYSMFKERCIELCR